MAAPAPKKPARKAEASRPALPADHAVVGFNALMNLASLVTSSCKECHGQWIQIAYSHMTPDLCELHFSCSNDHTAKWSSENNELVSLEPLMDSHAEEGAVAAVDDESNQTDDEGNGPFSASSGV